MKYVLGATVASLLYMGVVYGQSFDFTPNTFAAEFYKIGQDLRLSRARKDQCHSLNKGGIECTFRVEKLLSYHVSAQNESSPATQITMMSGVAKDDPETVMHTLSGVFALIALANPDQPKERRGQLGMDLINAAKDTIEPGGMTSSRDTIRKLGRVTYKMSFVMGLWFLTAKFE